ncbi:MAG: serine/threonine-protein kinase [Planctomycetota bacterium]
MSGSDRHPLFVGQVLAGYRLEGKGGMGGFARVLRATRLSDGAAVALKLLRRKHRGQARRERQLLREGELLRMLDHPRVLRCLESGRAGPWTFLALPWIEGKPLSTVLGSGPLPRALALDCAFQALEALDYIHGKGVVHQDVKPDNLLLDRQRRCTLFDFGLATTREDRLAERAAGGPGRIVGTGSYRAPEQETPGAAVDTSADIYAFAVTLHRLLTAKLPDEETDVALLGERVAELIARCLDADPQARPTARDLRRELADQT